MGGGTVLYTGNLYQLMPAMLSLGKLTSRFEDSPLNRTVRAARIINKAVNLSGLVARLNQQDAGVFAGLLRKIACLLRVGGVEFGYLYDEELYTGALLYDQGLTHPFEEHAQRVYAMLRHHGVNRVITVDPHTTNMLRSVYPKVIKGYRLEVKSYLELLVDCGMEVLRKLDLDLVVHDSCVYARYEDIIDEPRQLLRAAGASLHEAEYSGRTTYCCGGPIESLFPHQAEVIAEQRLAQLAPSGKRIVTMCPICLVNLSKAAGDNNVSIKDISEYLALAYCGANPRLAV
jgi:Fe-S oxidoreductase